MGFERNLIFSLTARPMLRFNIGLEVNDRVTAPDESVWIQQAARGDRIAFSHLVDLHLDPIRCWLIRMTGKEHQAEDLAQETFLKAWVALPTYRQTGTF